MHCTVYNFVSSQSFRFHLEITKLVVSFFLLEVDRSYHNTQFRTRLFYCSYFIIFLAQFSTLGSAHRFYRLLLFNPVCSFYFFCVSYFDLQTFFFYPNPTSLFVPLCITFLWTPANIPSRRTDQWIYSSNPGQYMYSASSLLTRVSVRC